MRGTRHNVRCRAPDNVPGHSQIIGPPAKQCCKGMYVCVCARACSWWQAPGAHWSARRPPIGGGAGRCQVFVPRGGGGAARPDPARLPHAAPALPYISLRAVSCSSCPAAARPSSTGTLPGGTARACGCPPHRPPRARPAPAVPGHCSPGTLPSSALSLCKGDTSRSDGQRDGHGASAIPARLARAQGRHGRLHLHRTVSDLSSHAFSASAASSASDALRRNDSSPSHKSPPRDAGMPASFAAPTSPQGVPAGTTDSWLHSDEIKQPYAH